MTASASPRRPRSSPASRAARSPSTACPRPIAMTGWRIGYAGGPKELIGAMAIIQSQSTSNPCSISQAAAVAALNGDARLPGRAQRRLQERRDLVVDMLNRGAGPALPPARGRVLRLPELCRRHRPPHAARHATCRTSEDFAAPSSRRRASPSSTAAPSGSIPTSASPTPPHRSAGGGLPADHPLLPAAGRLTGSARAASRLPWPPLPAGGVRPPSGSPSAPPWR